MVEAITNRKTKLILDNSENYRTSFNFEPFGAKIPPYNEPASNTHKFTGQERDQSTAFDYMHFRFYASSMGRFLKPDNVFGLPMNPQNWNGYTYVKDKPVNFNDPSGHFAAGLGGRITQLSMKIELLGPVDGTIWDIAMGMFYDENIDGWFVSYSDWITTGGESIDKPEEKEKERVEPFASIPNASTLPEDQRNAYVLYGSPTPVESENKQIPFAGMAAGEACEVLKDRGYNVNAIQISSNRQLKSLASSGILKGATVVITTHNETFVYWNKQVSTSASSVAKWLGRSGAIRVIYLTCKSGNLAAKTSKIGAGMPTWGAKGYLNIKFEYVIPPPHLPTTPKLTLYAIDFWFLTH